MKIIVDAMGGDYAPDNVIAGVMQALEAYDISIALVGLEKEINLLLNNYSYPTDRIEVIHAPEVVDMRDPATSVLRQKKNSSISKGIQLLKEEGYDAFVSAGNTGAVVAASTVHLRMIEGVDRPAIGIVIPTVNGASFLIDIGANTEAKPEHLLQSGLMARVYMRDVMKVEDPTVGLLNIGEEESKGSGFEKQAYKLMEEHLHNFIGNVEANAVFKGDSDCVVCDGYVGNVVLKTTEGLMESVGTIVKREVKKNIIALIGAGLMKKSLMHIKKLIDYSEYGGAPLLGVNGIVMISHGRSSPKAIKNAIRAAKHEVEQNILESMRNEIKLHQAS